MIMKYLTLFTILFTTAYCKVFTIEMDTCNLPEAILREIASYAPVANKIINATVYGKYKRSTYQHLGEFVDKFGNRIAGSKNLENAIDYMLEKSKDFGLENVHGEDVDVPHWVRGEESATLIYPRRQPLAMLGLGSSIGTPPEGIRAEAIVVTTFDELDSVSGKVRGKIVVFDQDYVSYSVSGKYRDDAAQRSASYGAVATLVRSITPFSLYTPHAGWQKYADNVTKIPTAAITVEDAQMLRRMQADGEMIEIEIKMNARNLPLAISRNMVVEIKGSAKPEKVVIVSGHLDSWDVGQGAMDDGGGAFMSWNSLVVLQGLGLRPKRTLRAVLWTANEEGMAGAVTYAKQHANETQDINFVMESDLGTFTPLGLKYAGPQNGSCILQEILKLLAPINATQLMQSDVVGSDIMVWIQNGMPGACLYNQNERYFWYYHSDADTMDAEDPTALDKGTALWATVAYILADLSFDMPKHDSYV